MKFLASQDGYFNPMQVEAVVYESQSWTMHYAEDGRIEHSTQYTVYAMMTSGQKIPVTSYNTRDVPEADINETVNAVLRLIAEAMS